MTTVLDTTPSSRPCVLLTQNIYLLIPVSSAFALSRPSCTPRLSAFILHPSGGRRQCVTTGLCWRWPLRTRLPGTTWATLLQVSVLQGLIQAMLLQVGGVPQQEVGGEQSGQCNRGEWEGIWAAQQQVSGGGAIWAMQQKVSGARRRSGKGVMCCAWARTASMESRCVRILHLPIHPHTAACMTGLGRWDATAGHWRTLLPSLSPILTRVYHQIPNLLLAADGHVVLLAPPTDPHTAAC